MKLSCALFSLGMLTSINSAADLGDFLYIKGDAVNIRQHPSTNSSVVLKLNFGHKVVEVERDGDWIEVFPALTGGKSGWVHQSLVSNEFTGGGTTAATSKKFAAFSSAFQILNDKIKTVTGLEFFTEALDLGDGIVQVEATTTWFNADKTQRDNSLRTVFNMWDAADGTGLPIAVYVVDQHGTQRTKINRN
jgi:hypothetical protein